MACKSPTCSRTARRGAVAAVAIATAATLTFDSASLPVANAAALPSGKATQSSPGVPAMPLAPGAPDPAAIPDLTFGLGPRLYTVLQTVAAAAEAGLLDNVNLSGLWQYLGYDPESAVNTALGNLLTQALAGVPVDLSGVPVLGSILTGAGITDAAALLTLLGFDLADPLNLAGSAAPGLNIITAGAPFSLLRFLGVDLGWTPGFPDAVADEINGTPYLDVTALGVLDQLLAAYPVPPLKNTVPNATLQTLIGVVKQLPGGDLNAVDVRVPVVLGFGLGAFAAGMAYPQVVDELPNQPGGAQYTGDGPLLGSVTILPMILLRNPGRANGGLFARLYPVAALAGIDTVTPDTEVSSSVDPDSPLDVPVGDTGIVLGGANLIPVKVDATVEYDPLSDVPSWFNPVAVANSAAALLLPTYILRGVTEQSLTEVVDDQLTPQLAEALAATGPLALNLYLTVPVDGALPLLEPVKLPIDAVNLITGWNLNNPLATAVEPVLTSMVNLGYTDVRRTVVDGVPTYDRTLDQADVITPFGTLPSDVDWLRVPGDLLVQLGAGIEEAIEDGFVGDAPVAETPTTADEMDAAEVSSVESEDESVDERPARRGAHRLDDVVDGVRDTLRRTVDAVSGSTGRDDRGSDGGSEDEGADEESDDATEAGGSDDADTETSDDKDDDKDAGTADSGATS